MTFPIVMIFNQHHDSTPHILANDLLPELAAEGYDTFCQENSDNLSEEEFLKNRAEHIRNIDYVMNNVISYLANTEFRENLNDCSFGELEKTSPPDCDPTNWAKSIKHSAAEKLGYEGLQIAKKWGFSIVCIDDRISHLQNRMANEDPEQLIKTIPARDKTLSHHLFRLHANQKGVIVELGVAHYQGVVQNLKEKGLTDQDMVCHFAHRSHPNSESRNFLEMVLQKWPFPKEKITCATTHTEIALLGKKILSEVQSKIRYLNSCHSKFLIDFFKVNFKAILRSDYHVDAILPVEQVNETIRQELNVFGIRHHTNKKYFVIPNVNTTEVAHNLRLLKSPHSRMQEGGL